VLFVQGQDGFLEISAPGVFDVGEKDADAAFGPLFFPAVVLDPV
jgi:hypothetical protein